MTRADLAAENARLLAEITITRDELRTAQAVEASLRAELQQLRTDLENERSHRESLLVHVLRCRRDHRHFASLCSCSGCAGDRDGGW